MHNRQTLLLILCALLLGINIGLLLGDRGGAQLNLIPTATAGSPVISTKDNRIFTCSEDGTRLYEWQPKSAGTNAPNPWIATEHTK